MITVKSRREMMNRPIKFRAWDKHDKRFIRQAKYAVALNGDVINFDSSGYDFIESIELMQYTGLKDKNGVEIYEGDIVRVTDVWGWNTKHQIKYLSDSNYPAFDLVPWLEVETNGLTYCMGSDAEIEVIGNIYENPELLEAEL